MRSLQGCYYVTHTSSYYCALLLVCSCILVTKYTITVNISVDLDHYLYTNDKHKLRNGEIIPM